VTVVSPELLPGFGPLEVERVRRRFRPADVRDAFLAVAATDDPSVNEAVFRACRKRRVLVNVVDQPGRCTFIAPAVLRRGPVTISISTDGECPGLAKALRKRLEGLLPPSLGRGARSAAARRRRILRKLPRGKARSARVNRMVSRVVFGKAGAR
jgi:uroporphyrin-III C-methyltransferase/precorrin-2 dehydrogenase/sirohydrochlorin ferrochelatase